MHAVRMESYGGPEVLAHGEVADPDPPRGWVTVELRASALNWHDVLVRRGRYSSPPQHIPGADGAGVRTDTGEEVVILPSLYWGGLTEAPGPDFEILGDHVPGTYAEAVAVPAECLAPKPAGYSWAGAAALPLVGVTAYRALVTRARLREGESLLVVGASGGIATTALALAAAVGARAHVTASSQAKLHRALDGGAEAGVLHSDDAWPDLARAQSPGGQGFDVVLDPVGLWERSIRALRPGGRMVVLGSNVAETALLDIRSFYFGQFDLLGTTMGGPEDFRGLLSLIELRRVPPPPIAETFPLAQASRAHAFLESGEAFGKIVLTP